MEEKTLFNSKKFYLLDLLKQDQYTDVQSIPSKPWNTHSLDEACHLQSPAHEDLSFCCGHSEHDETLRPPHLRNAEIEAHLYLLNDIFE